MNKLYDVALSNSRIMETLHQTQVDFTVWESLTLIKLGKGLRGLGIEMSFFGLSDRTKHAPLEGKAGQQGKVYLT